MTLVGQHIERWTGRLLLEASKQLSILRFWIKGEERVNNLIHFLHLGWKKERCIFLCMLVKCIWLYIPERHMFIANNNTRIACIAGVKQQVVYNSQI